MAEKEEKDGRQGRTEERQDSLINDRDSLTPSQGTVLYSDLTGAANQETKLRTLFYSNAHMDAMLLDSEILCSSRP